MRRGAQDVVVRHAALREQPHLPVEREPLHAAVRAERDLAAVRNDARRARGDEIERVLVGGRSTASGRA